MNRTAYLPLRQFSEGEIVPTVKADYLRQRKSVAGYVHDRSAALSWEGYQEVSGLFFHGS